MITKMFADREAMYEVFFNSLFLNFKDISMEIH